MWLKPAERCAGVSGIFSAIPAAIAASKSTIHCSPESTVDPAGNAPELGVRFTASDGVMLLPRYKALCPLDTNATVHASGSASAVAAFSQELSRNVIAGNTGGG